MSDEAVKVLIVDDSAVVRETLKAIISENKKFRVIGTAADPYYAAQKIEKEIPHVITLDVEMPRMDGLSFLKKIMSQHPIPVVICSSKAGEGTDNALKALEYGAVDIIEKPKMGTKLFLEESKVQIWDTLQAAYYTQVSKNKVAVPHVPEKQRTSHVKYTADVVLPLSKNHYSIDTTEKIILVGASTGGTEALRSFLEEMPVDCPGILIVQHMPENFTAAFAKRLNGLCKIEVKEAAHNDSVLRGRALIAPGNKHMLLQRSGARYYVDIRDGQLVSRHRPSVDVLFRSAARYAGKNAIGIIMTGMGDDGARGMLEMKQAGAFNIAQDEKSCIVFGMPNEAIKRGAVDTVKSLHELAGYAIQVAQNE